MTNANQLTVRLARLALGTTLASAAAFGAGCHHHDEPRDPRVRGEEFRPTDEVRAVARFNDAQAATGARTDATLHPYHFDCGDLNSLGRRKIDLMLKDDRACTPLVVYLDVPQEDGYDARQESVSVYLKDRGLQDGQVKVVAGPNVTDLHPTGPALRAKRLLDTGAPVAVNPEPTGSAGAAAAATH